MAIIVQDIHSTSRNGLGNVLVIFIWSGARLLYDGNNPGHSQHIQVWSGTRFYYDSNDLGHSQHIQTWSGA